MPESTRKTIMRPVVIPQSDARTTNNSRLRKVQSHGPSAPLKEPKSSISTSWKGSADADGRTVDCIQQQGNYNHE